MEVNNMGIKKIINELSFEEKAKLLTGSGTLETYAVERLDIPQRQLADGPHGIRTNIDDNCTLFPNLCCVGATWDTDIVQKLGNALAYDCINHGIDMLLGPGVNIKRTPLCGRNFEYLAEDPVLAGELASAYVNGMQELGVGTSVKHYAANNQEIHREYISVEMDERTLREIYLKAFEIIVKKSNPSSIMCSYNKLYSLWCSENPLILRDILKSEWGYDGIVVSDWGAVHNSCRALAAGLDLQMPQNENIAKEFDEGIKTGVISETLIDEALERVLRFIMNKNTPQIEYNRKKQHEIATDIAADGITLLKNKDNVLPITNKKYKKIAVIGEYAKNPLICGQGSAEVYPTHEYIDSPINEMRKQLPDIEINYQKFYEKSSFSETMLWPKMSEFRTFIKDSDVVVMFIGSMTSEDTEKFDRRDADFNPNFGEFIDEAYKHNKKIVVVIQSGSAMIVTQWKHKVDAIVQMWLAGEGAGSAIAKILSGEINPSGKLPETFPTKLRKDLEYPGDGEKIVYKEGFEVGYRYYDLHTEEIAFPFGHGLSYTTFEYSDCDITQDNTTIDITFNISNTGEYSGKEVVQVYVSYLGNGYTHPVKELKAFRKVSVNAHDSKRVSISFAKSDLSYYNTALKQWILEPGMYRIILAASSQDIRISQNINILSTEPYTMGNTGESMMG